jgi:hypothetical protein
MYFKACIPVLLIVPITSAMDNSTLIRRHFRLEEEHRVNGQHVRNYVEAIIERNDEEEANPLVCTPQWLKNFVVSDFAKASIFLMIAGVTTISSVHPSTNHTSSSFNHTTMCPIHNCTMERHDGFKRGMIFCSLGMSALLCCSQCIKMCGDCGE